MTSSSAAGALNRRRDWIAAGLMFLAAAGFSFWQSRRIAVLWDLSYLLDTAWRMALGQVPYRDFPLVHPPLTFLIQALGMRMFGRHYLLPVMYAAVVSGLGTVIAWRVILRILRQSGRSRPFSDTDLTWLVSLLLTLPLVPLGIHGVYPHPIYDCDCAFAVLVAVWLLLRLADSSPPVNSAAGWMRPLGAGAAVAAPLFFKQNMGLPFLLLASAAIVALLLWPLLARRPAAPDASSLAPAILLRLLLGMALALAAGASSIAATAGLGDYIRWTVHFAAERRLPGFGDMIAVYRQPSFAWTIPCLAAGLILLCLPRVSQLWVRILGVCLASAPFAGSLIYLALNDDLDERADNLLALWPLLLLASAVMALWQLRRGVTLARFMPFLVLAAIHGCFLSQQLWGSTYAIWPLLMILFAGMLAALLTLPAARPRLSVPTLAASVSATFLVCGSLYAASHERLNYVQQPEGEISMATLPDLRGMRTPGPFLPELEELVSFAAAEIPAGDGILLLPGEDPFYFATGRSPHFPVLLFDHTADPYSATLLLAEADRRDIRWVIVKTHLQLDEDPLPERQQTIELIQGRYRLYRKLAAYDVYRRNL